MATEGLGESSQLVRQCRERGWPHSSAAAARVKINRLLEAIEGRFFAARDKPAYICLESSLLLGAVRLQVIR